MDDQAWYVGIDQIATAKYSFDSRNPRRIQSAPASIDEILEQLREPLSQTADSFSQANGISAEAVELKPSDWEWVPIRRFLSPSRNEAEIKEKSIYKQVTVKLYGKGAILRKEIIGAEIKTRPQFIVRSGQLIISRIDARNGAFALVPRELHNAVVTQDFPLFEVDENAIKPGFLALLLRSQAFVDACKRASRGTTNRKRLREALFLDELVPLPTARQQESILGIAANMESIALNSSRLARTAENAIPSLADFLFG